MTDIFLRSVCDDDLNAVYRVYSDRNACLQSGAKPVNSLVEAREYLERMIKNRDTFAIADRHSAKAIGFISVRRDIHRFNKKRYMLGYILLGEYRGQGIMPAAVALALRQAFLTFGADVVSAAHFPDNTASRRVLEKCGFTREGRLRREYVRFDGQVLDSVMYSMLYEEYKNLYRE